jgi:sugar phosphate permease
VFLFFSLGNSTDAFLLLKLKDSGVPAAGIAVLWSLHHIVKMTSTYGGGLMADRVNKRRLLIGGWIVYAAVYMMMGAVQSAGGAIALFLIYGLYFGLTEPVEKTMVSLFTDSSTRGTAFGFFHMVVGLAALPASLLFGWIWKTWSMSCAFSTGAALAGVAAVILLLVKTPSSVSLRP